MLENVFDFDRTVEGEIWKRLVHCLNNANRVLGAIEEIGVAKRDVRGSGLHLVLNVLKNDLLRHREESSPINRWDGAMKTKVFATTSCFRIAGQANHPILLKVGILFKRWEGVPPWYCEGERSDHSSGRSQR